MATKTRILIADDIVESARSLSDRLAQAGYVCEVATDADRALDNVRRLACDAVICDVQMEGSNEFELLDQIRALQPQLPVIVGTRTSSLREAVDAVKRGAFQYLEKPFIDSELLDTILLATSTSHHRTTLPPQ